MNNLSVSIYEGLRGLSELAPVWNDLIKRIDSPCFFQHIEWFEAYLECLRIPDGRTFFFLVSEDGQPVLILPMEKAKRIISKMPLRVWETPAHAHLPLNGLIADNRLRNIHLRYLFDILLKMPGFRCDAFILKHVVPGAHDSVMRQFDKQPWVLRENSERCSCIRVDAYEAWRDTLSKNFRGNLRKARNKLNKKENHTACATTGAHLDLFFNEFLRVESSGWKGRSGTGSAIALDEDVKRFYHSVAHQFSHSGCVEVNLLFLERQAIAGQYVLRQGRNAFILKIGYDESFARMAPGNLLFEDVMQRYAEEGVIQTVNLVTDRQWHKNWQPFYLPTFNYYQFNSTAKGRLAFFLKQLHRRWMAIRDHRAKNSEESP